MIRLGHRHYRVLAHLDAADGVLPFDAVLRVACTPRIPVRGGLAVTKRLIALGWIVESGESLELTPIGRTVVRAWPRKGSTAEVGQ